MTENLIVKGNKAFRDGNYAEALLCYERFLLKNAAQEELKASIEFNKKLAISRLCAQHGEQAEKILEDIQAQLRLEQEINAVRPYFDETYYLTQNPDVAQAGTDPVYHYCAYGWKEGRDPHPDFSTRFYLENYEDIRTAGIDPYWHYLMYGKKERRDAYPAASKNTIELFKTESMHEEKSEDISEIQDYCDGIDWEQYKHRYCPFTTEHPVLHYKKNWRSVKPVFPGFFDTSLYLEMYPDVAEAGIDPLLHYLKHGIQEGRIGWLDANEFIELGAVPFRPELKTIMIVSHESSATGAPVVALEVTRRLIKRYNVITITLRKGKLHDAFIETSCLHINQPNKYGLDSVKFILRILLERYSINGVIINSVESSELLYGAACLGLPTVSLLHEYSDYTRPIGKLSRAVFTTDIAIFPAASIAESALCELRKTCSIKTRLNHIRIKPQGSLRFDAAFLSKSDQDWLLRRKCNIPSNAIVLAGAGNVQPRKGVDWFLETAYQLLKRMRALNDERSKDVHFVWLGDGFSEEDINVSVWLETFMQQTGIKDRCHFPGHVDSVSAALREADVFLLTSRLDPFPNVAIDALESDCGIACFEGASGIADFVQEHGARAVVAPYGDCTALAEMILANLAWLSQRDGTNSQLCENHLDFERYVEFIDEALEEACRRKKEIDEVIEDCPEFTSRFDADYYGQRTLDIGPFIWDSRKDFLTLLQKGIVLTKPYPGSGVQRQISRNNYDRAVPLIDYVRELMQKDQTQCVLIDGSSVRKYTGRIAIHFHVYFNDLIQEYTNYFRALEGHSVDLYVSHTHELTEEEQAVLSDAIPGNVHFQRLPNLGRNVYPFHFMYLEFIKGHYDVVGHFHTKKSKDCESDIGVRWRKYLLQNLIGSTSAARQILSLFNVRHVGLIYAEDKHFVDEGENKPFIEQLLKEMGITPPDDFFDFPVGTMFWARVDALTPFSDLDVNAFKVAEPVPYDGTVLHAFERIVPCVVQHAGYEAIKVYTRGTSW